MNNTLTFHLCDTVEAGCNRASDELLSLLAGYSRTLWRMTSAEAAQEIMAPFRTAHFQVQVNGSWQTYQAAEPLPSVVRVKIETASQHEIRDRLWSTLDLPVRFHAQSL